MLAYAWYAKIRNPGNFHAASVHWTGIVSCTGLGDCLRSVSLQVQVQNMFASRFLSTFETQAAFVVLKLVRDA